MAAFVLLLLKASGPWVIPSMAVAAFVAFAGVTASLALALLLNGWHKNIK